MTAIAPARHHLAVAAILPRMAAADTIIVAILYLPATTALVVILDTAVDPLHLVIMTTSVIMAVATALPLLVVVMPVALQSTTHIPPAWTTNAATRTLLHPRAVMKSHIPPTVISVERDPLREAMGTRNVHVIGDFSSFALSGFPSIGVDGSLGSLIGL